MQPVLSFWRAMAVLGVVSALLVGPQPPAAAHDRPTLRLSAPVPATGMGRSAPSRSALRRAIRRSYPGVETRRPAGPQGLLRRVRRAESSRGIGVRQTFEPQGSTLILRTRLSPRARREMPALATAVRRFPTAVLVERTERGYVLQGPVHRTADGPVYDRIHVRPDGVTTVRRVDARTGLTVEGSRTLASRDWARHPAVVERPAAATVYAVSDVHGRYDRLIGLLTTHGLVAERPVRWIGGTAKLVVVGDMINRGPRSLAVVDLLRTLQTQAAAVGGEVIVTLGNHETGFLLEPEGRPAMRTNGFSRELRAHGLDPQQAASEHDPRGQWLRNLPFAVRIGRWLFAHSGDTGGRSLGELERALRPAVDAHDFDHREVTGRDSILRSVEWHERNPERVAENISAAGVDHIVFGHHPRALGHRGRIAVGHEGALLRIDTGRHAGNGALLRLTTRGGRTVAEALGEDGSVTELLR